jgi:nitric oxide reductase NorQ protein
MAAATAELVDTVLKAMKGASLSGDPDAVASLDKMTPAEGKAKAPKAGAAAKASAVAGTPLTAGSKIIKLPFGSVEYHVRNLKGHDDVEVLRKSRAHGLNVMAYGPPGTGKTVLILAAFAEHGDPVFTVQGSGDTEVSDFVGGYVPLPGGSFEWVDGPLLKAMEAGAPLYVDEIALIDPKVLAVLYGVMDGRGEYTVTQNPARGTVVAKDGFYVISACNPNAPGARMSEALLSRFPGQFLITTDYTLARKMGVDAKVVTAAINLQKKVSEGETSWAPQMRELLNFKKTEALFGYDFALDNLVSQAPEIDRPVVADVLTRSVGKPVAELALR